MDRMQKRGVYWEKGRNAEDEDAAELNELRANHDRALKLRNDLRLVGELAGIAMPAQPRQ
jgi:hypothetical protein